MTTHTGRIEASRHMLPVLAQIRDNVGRGEYVKMWALRMGIREEELLADVRQYRTEHRLDQNRNQPQRTAIPTSRQKAVIKAGYLQAEQQILALYLLSIDDYERVNQAFADWSFVSKEHQRIKDEIQGIGTQFNTVDDLQYKLQDRLAPESNLAAALIEIILLVEEMRKQASPIDQLIFEFKARLIKEKLTRVLATVRAMLASAQNDEEQQTLQSKIAQLNQLERISLTSARTVEHLDDLQRRIDSVA